jgi:hypothetical protein
MAIKATPAQQFVPIKEVRDGVIILKDGGLRAVLLASSINLSLKSADEQRAVILQFQSFLNSLDFTVEICVQSRRLDIRPYLSLLENRLREIEEPLLKVQTREYIEFIRNFTESVNIMTKNFFVVVPYSSPATNAAGGLAAFGNLFLGKKQTTSKKTGAELDFEEKRSQLDERLGIIEQGLSRMGIRTAKLGTEEIVELFYKVFNPGETSGAKRE